MSTQDIEIQQKTLIYADSSFDLPRELARRYNIKVIPSILSMGDHRIIDDHASEMSVLETLVQFDFNAQATAYEMIADQQLLTEISKSMSDAEVSDAVIITATRLQAQNYQSINQLSQRISQRVNKRLRIIGSRTLYSAQGLLVLYAVRLLEKGLSGVRLRQQLVHMSDHLYCYAIPRDLAYVRKRGKERGEKTAPWAIATVGKMADLTTLVQFHQDKTQRIGNLFRGRQQALGELVSKLEKLIKQDALLIPQVILSYGGAMEDIQHWPELNQLQALCRAHRVELIQTTLNMGGLYHLGPGTVTLGFAAREHDW